MAVSSTTAPDPAGAGVSPTRGGNPIRTCIGCRKRAAAAELLRVVAVPGPTPEMAAVVPDPRHRLPGRGAWLHRDPGCVELAERRRAFGRALRVPGQLDPAVVREYVTDYADKHGVAHEDPTSGTPQE